LPEMPPSPAPDIPGPGVSLLLQPSANTKTQAVPVLMRKKRTLETCSVEEKRVGRPNASRD
jgi:hypothetical protein